MASHETDPPELSEADGAEREPHDLIDDEETPLAPILIGGAFFAMLAAGVAWLLLSPDSSEVIPVAYDKDLDEVVSAPEEFAGKTIRVQGALRNGSICFRENPCEWRFIIEGEEHSLTVHFPQCVVPDTFRDQPDVTVTARGQLEDGVFIADEIIPQCPSRYEPGDEPGGQMPSEGEMAPPVNVAPAHCT